MSEAKNARRERSPAFPSIPLNAAIERLGAFEKYFGRHPASADQAGRAWGLKTADQTIAALRYFGLLEYGGRAADRQISISEDGRNYIRAQQDTVKRDILKRAALRPREIRKFWSLWGADRPPNDVCLDQLTFKNGYSDRGARVFLKVYDATIGFAGLVDADKIPLGAQDDDGGEVRDLGDGEDDFTPDPPPPPPPPPPPADKRRMPVMEGERVVFTEEGQPNQYLKLIASGPIDDGLLEALEDFVKRQRRRVSSNDALRRDRERFEQDLASFEQAGLGNSSAADTIRRWIAETDQILNRPS